MKPERARVDELHQLLSRLSTKETLTKEDLHEWYTDARYIQGRLTESGGIGPFVPELVWHYLADADIRSKDPVYRAHQDELVHAFLTLLATGEMPDEEDVRVAIRERYRG